MMTVREFLQGLAESGVSGIHKGSEGASHGEVRLSSPRAVAVGGTDRVDPCHGFQFTRPVSTRSQQALVS
jgi:hypothetical protein